MITTGATVWDFLIAMRIPIWLIIIAVILVFCISHADKLLAISGAVSGLFRNISKTANKKYISASIRSSVIAASKRIGPNESQILPNDLKIKWADNDDVSSFFDDDCVIVRLRQTADPNENYVNIIFQFVSSGLLKNQKHYFNERIMDASTLLITQKIVSLSKPSANAFFFNNIYKSAIEADHEVDENFKQLQRIDFNGMLFNIYFNELLKASATIEGQIPDPALKAESGELLRFLYRIANRGPEDESVDLKFKGVYFNLGIILAANDDTLNKSGWSTHLRYAKQLLDDGYTTLYIFGIGQKAKIATNIAYAVKQRDERIVKSITHQYRHVNASNGKRYTAACVELDTY